MSKDYLLNFSTGFKLLRYRASRRRVYFWHFVSTKRLAFPRLFHCREKCQANFRHAWPSERIRRFIVPGSTVRPPSVKACKRTWDRDQPGRNFLDKSSPRAWETFITILSRSQGKIGRGMIGKVAGSSVISERWYPMTARIRLPICWSKSWACWCRGNCEDQVGEKR